MKNAGKACNNRLYRHIRTFEKIIKNYFVILLKYLFLVTDKPEVNYLSIPAIRLQNGKCEIRHILRDELELPKEV